MAKKRDLPEMNVQETVNPQDEAQRIWDQLDADEAGGATQAENAQDFPQESTPSPAESTGTAPADKADAHGGSEEAAPTAEQALLDKISGLETMLGQVTSRLRNAEGHIGGLNSQLKQQFQAAQQITSKGGDAPTAGEIRAAQQNPEAMSNLKRDYPEFAEAMESALNERLSVLEQRIAAQPHKAQQLGVSQDEIGRLRSEVTVEIRHPGWQDRVQTPEFVGWLHRQPREVQMLAESERPQDAVRLLDLHADAANSTTTQRNQRLSAAAAIPSGRSGSSARQKAVEDMTPQEYWRYLDELDRKKGN
jgi:hypothetical protein